MFEILPLAICGVLLISGLLALLTSATRTEATSSPKLSCADAADASGKTWLEGTACTDAPLRSPLTGTPCIYFELTSSFTEVDPEAHLRINWGTNEDLEREDTVTTHMDWETAWAERWWIDDGTGTVEISGTDARLQNVRVHLQRFHPGAPELGELRARYSLGDKDLAFTEKLIPVDVNVVASGRLARRGEDPLLVCSSGNVTVGTSESVRASGATFRWVGLGMVALALGGFGWAAWDAASARAPAPATANRPTHGP